jgi:PAS domain S-box-containing protein
MPLKSPQSVYQKLAWLIFIASGLGLGCVLGALAIYEYGTEQPRTLQYLQERFLLIEEPLARTLELKDSQTASHILKDLGADSTIQIAAIYDRSGELFSPPYSRVNQSANVPKSAGNPGVTFTRGQMLLWQPITQNGVPLGRLYLVKHLRTLPDRLIQYGILAGGVLLALLVSGLVMLRGVSRHFFDPVSELLETTRRVTREENYGFRAKVIRHDELGHLAESFNHMIEVLGERDAALRAANSQIKDVFDAATGIAIIATDVNGLVTLFNSGAENLLGYPATEIVGQKTPQLWHLPEELSARSNEIAARIAGKFPRLDAAAPTVSNPKYEENEWTFVHRDGRRLKVNLVVTEIHNAAQTVTGFLGIATDITARREMEQALRISERRLQYAISATSDSVWEWDVQTNETYFSPRWYEMLGLADRELPMNFETWKSLCHPDDLPRTMEQFDRILKSPAEANLEVEYRLRARDGSWLWILARGRVVQRDPQGRPRLASGTNTDMTDRKRAEAALKERELKYRLLFENMTSGFALHEIICDAEGKPENYRFLEINPAFESLTGWKAREVLGRTIREVAPKIEPYWIESFGRVALTGRSISHENYVAALGRYFDTWAFSPQPGQFAVIFSDVTARKNAEKALTESEAKYHALFDSAHDAIFLMNDQVLVDCNKQTEAMFGCARNELIGHSPLEFSPPTQPDGTLSSTAVREKVQAAFAGTSQFFEWLHWRRDRSPFAAEVSLNRVELGGQMYLQAIVRNITERRQAEAALHASLREISDLRTALDEHALVVATDAKGVITYVNDKFCAISQFAREELVGRTHRVVNSGHHPPEFFAKLWQTISSARPWHDEICNRAKDGSIFWVATTIVPFLDVRGRPFRYISIRADITQSKKLGEQLLQSQKLEAIGRLSGGVAHDFNNILTVIQGNVALLDDTPHLTAEERESLVDIKAGVDRAAGLTRQLLAFSRRQTMQLADLDLNQVVGNMARMFKRIVGEDIQIQLTSAEQPAHVRADAGMLEQLLMNLVVNSRDAMPNGGQVTIETAFAEFDAQNLPYNPQARAGSFVCLRVCDNGCGIPPEALPRIFEPFFTTKDVGKGTGLGLATVYGIVQQHNGWVTVETEAGKGTTFRIYIPRLREAKPTVHAPQSVSIMPAGNETVLLVEDELSLRILAKKILTKLGYTVLEAASGMAALTVWAENRDQIALVLTDLVMPDGLNGLELAEQLRRDKPGIKIIYTSGYSAEIAGKDFPLKEGVNFLSKPFVPQRLAVMIRESLDQDVK